MLNAILGDKVRLKTGPHSGERGVVDAIDGARLVVRLDRSGQKARVLAEQVTNFSLAARKAWVTEPHRAVGRKRGTKLSDRLSVTLRIDRHLWERFVALEASGLIDDRIGLINAWLREKLADMERKGRQT